MSKAERRSVIADKKTPGARLGACKVGPTELSEKSGAFLKNNVMLKK